MSIITFKNIAPLIDREAYISPSVDIIGAVTIGKDSSIWFASVLRGDVAPISIGFKTNIQDGTIIHTSRFDGPTNIGNNVTIGHRALIHACTIEDYGFIGMGATILDKAKIESFGFVAAGAVVTPGKIVRSRELWSGVPAKYLRDLSDKEVESIKESAEHYVRLSKFYIEQDQ
jgi:carbonic anhydrase/acetyltransferase-like protein (isoleucine patch superfamily)